MLNTSEEDLNEQMIIQKKGNTTISDITVSAKMRNASHVLCIHNHPSGDPTPSTEDLQITKRIKLVGDLLGISLIDHIVLGGDTYYSFKEQGNLRFKNQENDAA